MARVQSILTLVIIHHLMAADNSKKCLTWFKLCRNRTFIEFIWRSIKQFVFFTYSAKCDCSKTYLKRKYGRWFFRRKFLQYNTLNESNTLLHCIVWFWLPWVRFKNRLQTIQTLIRSIRHGLFNLGLHRLQTSAMKRRTLLQRL